MFGFFKRDKGYNNIDVAKFQELSANPDSVIIDVRTESEAKSGKIPKSKLINVTKGDFRSEVSKLDKSKTYLLYCRSGMRSAMACKIMKKEGFENLNNLSGGIMAWNKTN